MKHLTAALFLSLTISGQTLADPAASVIGDYTFPNEIVGMPAKLSAFTGLEINSFMTNDGVRLNYWEAGSGAPIVFVPAWGASGAEMINQLWLLAKTNHVYVLDQRNQGTSEKTLKGQRIARYSMDLHEFLDHIGTDKTVLAGWSMGASVIWGYIDLFGTARISKCRVALNWVLPQFVWRNYPELGTFGRDSRDFKKALVARERRFGSRR